MSIEDLLRQGRLSDALAGAQDSARKEPAVAKHRVLLFQLYALQGKWEKAATQLGVISGLDASMSSLVQTYGTLLQREGYRGQVFQGLQAPTVFGEPDEWIAALVEANRLGATGKVAESQELRVRAFDLAPTTSGHIDGRPFEWLSDADPRFGPTLEAIVNGRYFWIPFARLRRIQIEKPADLRDLVWMPATLTLATGAEVVAFIPARYPGSESVSDPQVVLARKTDWIEKAPDLYCGLGQRMFSTNGGDVPLFDARLIAFDTQDAASPSDG